MSMFLQRHARATVRAGVPLPPTPAGRWLAAGGAGIVCRSEPGATTMRLGVCLPREEAEEKPVRGACEVDPTAVDTVLPPLELSAVLPSAPPAWRDGLATLVEQGAAHDVHWQVFGSLAWQHLHGGRPGFVNEATSDVDLLFTPETLAGLDAAMNLLRRFPGPPRLDGEIVFSGGRGVSWRELAGGIARVLVKRLDGVALVETASLRAALLRP